MRKILLLLLIPLALAGWFAFRQAQPAVAVTTPQRGPAVQGVYATGTVEASVMLPIAARISARLMELRVDEGAKVSKGQLLAQLEDTDLRHTLEQLRTRENLARKEFQRAAQLIKSKAISAETYDRAQSDLKAAEAASHNAEAQLSYLQLLAPENGTIIRRDGEIGELIPLNHPVFWLSTEAPLRISAEVDEEDIAHVKPGQKVLIRADAFPGQVFEGNVLAITPKGDPIARSYRVRVGFTAQSPLMIGMTAETNIIIRETENALLVPTTSIQNGHAWGVKSGKLIKAPVTTGAKGPEKIEILSGLEENDIIVLHPNAEMKEGESVRTNAIRTER